MAGRAGGVQQRGARRMALGALLALAAEVEERVVDADRHADQQDHGLCVASPAATTWLASADRPSVASTPEKASSTGSPAATSAPNANSRITSVTGSDEYSARWKSLFSVSLSSWFALAKPNSATVKRVVAVLHAGDGVEHRLHPLVGRLLVALHLELDEHRVAVVGDLARVAGRERRAHVLDLRPRRDGPHDVRDRGAERRIGDGLRLRLDEHALVGAVREVGLLQDLLGRLRLAGGGVGVLQHPRAGDGAERDCDDAEREPGRNGRLPVSGAPAAGARGDVESHRGSPFSCVARQAAGRATRDRLGVAGVRGCGKPYPDAARPTEAQTGT